MNKQVTIELAVGIIVLAALGVGAFTILDSRKAEAPKVVQEIKEEKTQIANPASVYCQENGGKSEIRNNPDGSQTGYCLFENGNECEEWAFMRGECKKISSDVSIDTSKWETYKSIKHGFIIKIPNDWKDVGWNDGNLYPIQKNEFDLDSFSISSPDRKNEIVFSEGNFDASHFKCNSEEVEISGEKVEKHICDDVIDNLISPKRYNYEFVNRNFTILFYSESPIISKIISTLKFTESENNISNWKTYRNEKYGFEFKYPKEFESTKGFENEITINSIKKDLEVPSLTVNVVNGKRESLIEDAIKRLNDSRSLRGIFNRSIIIGSKNGVEIGNNGYIDSEERNFREIYIELDEETILVIKDVEMEKNIADKIISSFKFIN